MVGINQTVAPGITRPLHATGGAAHFFKQLLLNNNGPSAQWCSQPKNLGGQNV